MKRRWQVLLASLVFAIPSIPGSAASVAKIEAFRLDGAALLSDEQLVLRIGASDMREQNLSVGVIKSFPYHHVESWGVSSVILDPDRPQIGESAFSDPKKGAEYKFGAALVPGVLPILRFTMHDMQGRAYPPQDIALSPVGGEAWLLLKGPTSDTAYLVVIQTKLDPAP